MSLRIPANVRVTASGNGWMTSDKLQEWLGRVWGPNSDDVRRLLVLDQAPIHKTQATKDNLELRDTDVVYVPAGCTSLLQPADVYWNRPFKANLRRAWENFIRKEQRTPKGNLRKPSRQDALDFVSEAWAAATEETVARSFQRVWHCQRARRFRGCCDTMHSYTVKKKIEVVEWHRHNGKNVHATARHFNLDRKRTREWEKKYETLLQQNFGKAKLQRKLSNGAPVFSEEVDDALFEFLERERSAGRAVSNRLLSEEAVKIAHSLQLGNFLASSQYIKRWKQRFGVTMRQATNESQKTPEDFTEAAKASRSAVNALRIRHDYTLFNISNMDQTMVRMNSPANRTNNVVGESTV
ncbi:hypothetical protein HPB50_023386 [Hyalomma asiaticum]|uniref:Uncharacterized protein n=1 Tax=Hyalomma asiaticum TaxID=266040 RepID=A0ACB7S5Z2_HYAAI|nr:hypothetical protein HPB50_023386 [Hyalomma asiaticum]